MATNICAQTGSTVNEADIENGTEIHLPAPDGTCRPWIIVGEKEANISQGRSGWRALEMGDEARTEDGKPPLTGLISMVYDDVLHSFHKPI